MSEGRSECSSRCFECAAECVDPTPLMMNLILRPRRRSLTGMASCTGRGATDPPLRGCLSGSIFN